MQNEQHSLDLSEIEIDRAEFNISRASILLDGGRPDQNSHAKKSTQNDTANIETRCDKKEQPYIGSFMRDLAKFQKETSYDSEIHDIYKATATQTCDYRHKVKEILSPRHCRQTQRHVDEYIFDFGKTKPPYTKKSSQTVKLKTFSNSPKTPKPSIKETHPNKMTEACQQYYGYETPKHQHIQPTRRRKNSGSSNKSKSVTKLILFDTRESHRSTSRFSSTSKPMKFSKSKK